MTNLFRKLFDKKSPSLFKADGSQKTSGKLIAEITDGANLVDGKQTWEYVENKKHDIDCMKKCCEAELNTMLKVGIVPAPYYFERVAIISRKEKNYEQEISYCEKYINTIEYFYKKHGTENVVNMRNSPRFKAIQMRLPKAKELLAKQSKK